MLPPHRPFRDKPADAAAAPAVAARPGTAGPPVVLGAQPGTRMTANSRRSLKADLKIAGRAAQDANTSGTC